MRRSSFVAGIIVLLAIVLLCGLGAWQVRRLQWKESLLAQLDHAYANPTPPFLSGADIARLSAYNNFAAARLRGQFMPGHYLLMGIRTWQGQMGYHLLTPFRLDDGGVVLVNRGWVPLQLTAAMETVPTGKLVLRGILHRPDHDNPFVPQNDPARNRWYRWNLLQMAHAVSVVNLAPMVLYMQGNTTAQPPLTAALRWTLPNNHLYYACFWFGMAALLAIMYGARFVVKINNRQGR